MSKKDNTNKLCPCYKTNVYWRKKNKLLIFKKIIKKTKRRLGDVNLYNNLNIPNNGGKTNNCN